MLETIRHQIAWSRETFGPGARVKGNTAHVLKELLEYRAEPGLEEAVDIAMLAVDGLWRQAAELFPDASADELAEVIAVAYDSKFAKNQARAFPRTVPDVPSEGRPGKWKPTDAVFDVLAERCRQVEGEGWTTEHDDAHGDGEMAAAAACYALRSTKWHWDKWFLFWPWSRDWWKPSENIRRMLVKACALLIAEIERLDRKAAREAEAGK